MNKEIEIIKSRLREQQLFGKESFTISEINKVLVEVETLLCNNMKILQNDEIKETPEHFFNSVMDKITDIKIYDRESFLKCYMIGSDICFTHCTKRNNIYIRNAGFWSVFKTTFGLSYNEISELTKSIMKYKFNCNVNNSECYGIESIEYIYNLESAFVNDKDKTYTYKIKSRLDLMEHLKNDVI